VLVVPVAPVVLVLLVVLIVLVICQFSYADIWILTIIWKNFKHSYGKRPIFSMVAITVFFNTGAYASVGVLPVSCHHPMPGTRSAGRVEDGDDETYNRDWWKNRRYKEHKEPNYSYCPGSDKDASSI
jgi:hypothetical protein